MSRVPVFQLMFLLVQLSEFANTQRGVSSADTTKAYTTADGVATSINYASPTRQQQLSTSTNTSIELTVGCVRGQKCVYELRKGVSGLFESTVPVTGLDAVDAPPCQNESQCSTDRTPCLCCEQNTEKTRDVLQDYDDAYKYHQVNLQLELKGQTNNYTEAQRKLQNKSTQLLGMCTTLYCDVGTRECKYVVCTCEKTTHPSETATGAAVNTVRTPYTERTSTPYTGPTSVHTTTSTSTSAAGLTDGDSQNVTAIALGVVVAVLVAAGVAVFIVWWLRRKGAKKGGGAHHSPSTIAFVAETERDDSPYSELSDVDRRDHKTANGTSMSADFRISEHEYSYIPADLVGTSHSSNGPIDNAGYDVARDITTRKLPSTPEQDGDYSLAENPPLNETKETPLHPSAPQPSVYDVPPSTRKKQTPLHSDALGQKAETSAEGHEKNGQSFNLDENAADADKDQEKGQYFVLEEDAAKSVAAENKDGEYFILEDGAATAGAGQEKDGQYFVLEDDSAKEQETGGQYFVLEDDAARSATAKGGKAKRTHQDTEYSTLDRADMVPRDETGQDSVYTALDNTKGGKAAAQALESSSEFESDYSLQKPI